MPEVGSASLAIIPSFKGFQSNLESGTGKAMSAAGVTGGTAFGDSAGRAAGSRFRGHMKSFAKVAALGLAGVGAAALKLGADSVQAASDLAESTNKVEQVFGAGADRVFKFAEKAADKFGQTNQQARDAAATFGIFGKVAQMTDRQNAKFAIRMDKLASDLASFHNTSPEEAIQAIGAAMRGEAEPIRKYGVLLDEATLKAEALSMGLLKPVKDQSKIKSYQVAILEGQKKYNDAVGEYGKDSIEALKAEASLGTYRERLRKATEGTIPPLTQQQKVMAAQSVILKQTKVAQGDFARTSDGLANAQRRLSARWEDAKAKLGTALLPVVNKFVKFLNDKGIPVVEKFADWFNEDGFGKLKQFGGELGNVAGHIKDIVGFLNNLPKSVKVGGLAAILGGVGYAKLRGGNSMGGGGLLGGVGKAVGLAKPVPVFVTNPGFGGDGLPGSKGNGGKFPWLAAGATAAVIGGGSAASFKANKGNVRAMTPQTAAAGGGMTLAGIDPLGLAEDADKATDAIIRTNDAASKLPNQLDQGKTAAERLVSEVFNLKSGMDQIPTNKATRFDAPNLLSLLDATYRYKGMLDGLDGRTVTTFLKSVRVNNDTGESGDPRFGGFRAHGGSMHPGYTYRVGENGPETVTVGARSTVTPNEGATSSMPTTVILNVDGEQFRAYVDNRINAAGRHPTGRRR